MQLVRRYEVLESVFVEMDPVLHGFGGVLLELLDVGESYVLLETAVGTGRFSRGHVSCETQTKLIRKIRIS